MVWTGVVGITVMVVGITVMVVGGAVIGQFGPTIVGGRHSVILNVIGAERPEDRHREAVPDHQGPRRQGMIGVRSRTVVARVDHRAASLDQRGDVLVAMEVPDRVAVPPAR